MNDLIRLAMERAAKKFGGGDGVFNAAGFSNQMMSLATLDGVIDGRLVRTMLAGRRDVEVMMGGHYRLREIPNDHCGDDFRERVFLLLSEAAVDLDAHMDCDTEEACLQRIAHHVRRSNMLKSMLEGVAMVTKNVTDHTPLPVIPKSSLTSA